MKQRVLLFVCCFATAYVHAQPANIDSLRGVWDDPARPDTVRLQAMNVALRVLVYNRTDSALVLGRAMEKLAEDNGHKAQQSFAVNIQGIAHFTRAEYPQALERFERGLALRSAHGDKMGMLSSTMNIGNVYKEIGRPAEAMARYEQAARMSDALGDHERAGEVYYNIGTMHYGLDDLQTARRYVSMALERVNDPNFQVSALSGMGKLYRKMGPVDSALYFFNKGYATARTNQVAVRYVNFELDLAQTYAEMGKRDSARAHIDRAMVLSARSGGYDRAAALRLLARSQMQDKDYAKALRNLEASQKLLVEGTDFAERKEVYELLRDVYMAMGQSGKALAYNTLYLQVTDSMRTKEAQRSLAQMEFRRQISADSLVQAQEKAAVQEAHDAQMGSERNRKRLFMFGGAGILVVAVGLWFVLGRTRKEKARSEEILHNVLPEEIARELKEKGVAASKEIDQVSILFTDFKGFTALSEKLSRAELMTELDACFNAFDGIIGRHGVEKIKTIGDSYMCAAGLKGDPMEAARNMVLCGLEMQAFMKQHKALRDAEGKPAFEMRLGIHTGPVVAGIVGVKKFQYDVWGDTVNTASRMESSGEVGQVNISEATYALVKDVVVGSQLQGSRTTNNEQLSTTRAFTFTPRGKVQAKGKGEMEMYFVQIGQSDR